MKSTIFKLLLPLAVATALPASAKLAAWYPLDESSSSAATAVVENVADNDAAMIGYDPTPNSDFNFVERGYPSATLALGTSYRFDKGGALDLGTNAAVQPTDQFTISFFTQLGTVNAFDRYFESQSTNTNDQDGLRIDTGGQGDRVRVLVRDNSGVNSQLTHPTALLTDGSWYFVAFRYDSANADGNAFQITVLKVDGSTIDEAAIAAATSKAATINTGAIGFPHAFQTLIGTEIPEGLANGLNGAIDEVAFFDNSDDNGVLTDAQLAANASFGPSGVQLITGFSTDRQSVSPGNPATFSWTITDPYDTLVLDDGNGNVTDLAPLTSAGSGSTMVSPTETTTYYLKGTNGDVENTHAIKILSGAAPEISTFTSSAPILQVDENVVLTWNVIGADTITLDPGATDVSALTTTNVILTGTTTFTLTATNGFGSTTADVTVTAISGPLPNHRYIAATDGNSEAAWADEVDIKNLNVIGLLRNAPLLIASPNTNIAAAYQAEGGDVGATVGAYQDADATFEIWLRPSALTAAHQVVFETGGGQNGIGVLITQDGLRFIGSAKNARTLDVVLPLDGVNLDDFIQVVFSVSSDNDTFEASVRDTYGKVVTASATADVIFGGNGATLFFFGSGGIGGSNVNLGGRTEVPDAEPAILESFVGEIGILNTFSRILTTEEITAAFDAVATITSPPSGGPNAVTAISYNGVSEITLTWNSKSGENYDAEFSPDLENWFPIGDPVEATEASTTKTFNIPANRPQFFLRIIEVPAP